MPVSIAGGAAALLLAVGGPVLGTPVDSGAATGSVSGFGAASGLGSPSASRLRAPLVGMAASPTGKGYWLVTTVGRVDPFGAADSYGTQPAQLDAPVVGMAATPTGKGYWLVAADGGVFTYGSAGFHGSMGGRHLNAPIVGMAATPTGKGYWLVAADGGVFTLGTAGFDGSLGGTPPSAGTPVVGMAATPTGHGYWITTTDRSLPPTGAIPSVLSSCNVPGTSPSVRPARIMLACGDGNAYVEDLTWSSWTATSAAATGNYVHNLCVPTCAAGKFVSQPATVHLGHPVVTAAGPEFSELGYTVSGSTFRGGIPTTPY